MNEDDLTAVKIRIYLTRQPQNMISVLEIEMLGPAVLASKAQVLKSTFSEQYSFSENYFLTNYFVEIYICYDHCRKHGRASLFPLQRLSHHHPWEPLQLLGVFLDYKN
jgi:hypothetical protein